VAAIPGAFFLGRETTGKTRSAARQTVPRSAFGGRTYILRGGDQITYPEAATECFATGEAGFPNLLCEARARTPGYEVAFYTDSFLVYGGPDTIPFSGRWATFAKFVMPGNTAYCGSFRSTDVFCWRPADGLTLGMSSRGHPTRRLDSTYKSYHDPISMSTKGSGAKSPNLLLPFGRTYVVRSAWKCPSRRPGLTCTNRDGHGWFLGRRRGSRLF
jgi:hypothetical protein